MKRILFIIFYLSSAYLLYSQVNGIVMDSKGNPIPRCKVLWQASTSAVETDARGYFKIPSASNSTNLVFQRFDYNSDTLRVQQEVDTMRIFLTKVQQLNEVSVYGKSIGLLKPRNAVIATQKITVAELCKAACCNLSESFETNPSVDVSYADAATGAKQIKMLGLSGSYVQLLTENVPNLRGIASPYGLGFIPGPWMESIQISKGTSSVINGYEAITGQINVEYKKPQKSEKLAVNMFASDAGRLEANVNTSIKLSEGLSTGLLMHVSDELNMIDNNKDNFMDMPMVKQYNFINRWMYKKGDYISQFFIRGLNETRVGGQMNGGYHINIESERYEFFLKNGFVFSQDKARSIGLIVSGSLHDQKALYGIKEYMGSQDNLYGNLIYQTNVGERNKVSVGSSFNFDNFQESLLNGVETKYPRKEYVSGLFTEYTYNWKDKFIALAGLRVDYNSTYGTFLTPRLHLKYNVTDKLHLRANAGKGYRSPNVLAENNYLLASNRIISIANNLKIEDAWNFGFSSQYYLDLFGRELSLLGEWYYTNFKNQVVVDMDSDPHTISFYNLNGKSYSSSAQLEASMEVLKGLTMTLAHRISDVKTTIGGILRDKPLYSRTKSLITASYQTPLKKWQFDLTAQLNGGGRMPDSDTSSPLWNEEFKPYNIFNAQITKYFRTWSVYLGSENMTNFVQQNPIINVSDPTSNDFDASMIWGPMHGRKIYLGFRWALD